MMAQVHNSLPLTWEAKIEFLAPDFGLSLSWLFWVFGGANQCLSAFQIKWKKEESSPSFKIFFSDLFYPHYIEESAHISVS